MDFDADCLYPTEMADRESEYPKLENRFSYRKDMNDDLVNEIGNQSFEEGGASLL